jgi:glycerol uptake facilitator protein
MENFVSELLGTFTLVLLGNGVVAGVVLAKTKSNSAGWVVITMGWGFAVLMGIIVAFPSGAHINPAVSLAALVNPEVVGLTEFTFNTFLIYVSGQMVGAFLGAATVVALYWNHYQATEDAGSVLATFSTGPAIRNTGVNLFSEVLGTFVLVFVIAMIGKNSVAPANILLVPFLVMSIGMSLGGVTGYAINPARDLGPRIAHFLLPVPNKGDSDWGYSWIPVVGPLLGGALAALLVGLL